MLAAAVDHGLSSTCVGKTQPLPALSHRLLLLNTIFVRTISKISVKTRYFHNQKIQKQLPGSSSEGPGTDMPQASRLRQIFIQFGIFYKPVDHHSVRRYLLVPSPFAFVFVLCHFEAYTACVICVLRYVASIVIRIMLLLSGNVEMNPGPFTQEQTKRILEVLELLSGIQTNQNVILAEMEAIKQTQTSIEEKLSYVFSTRIA